MYENSNIHNYYYFCPEMGFFPVIWTCAIELGSYLKSGSTLAWPESEPNLVCRWDAMSGLDHLLLTGNAAADVLIGCLGVAIVDNVWPAHLSVSLLPHHDLVSTQHLPTWAMAQPDTMNKVNQMLCYMSLSHEKCPLCTLVYFIHNIHTFYFYFSIYHSIR